MEPMLNTSLLLIYGWLLTIYIACTDTIDGNAYSEKSSAAGPVPYATIFTKVTYNCKEKELYGNNLKVPVKDFFKF